MLITGVLCVCAAGLCAALGLWRLSQPQTDLRRVGSARLALRAMAPAQLAAAVMFAAGGTVALAAPSNVAVMVVVICVAGAVGTVVAGTWQTARFAVPSRAGGETVAGDCDRHCATCTLSCRQGLPAES